MNTHSGGSKMTESLHTFTSGATSGELKPRYNLSTGFGEKVTALRFGYGNEKHENGTRVLAEANWLKAFHARDLAFFQDRMNHARDHLRNESQGIVDRNPGGNWGAIGWCVDIMPFVAQYDPEFYRAVQGTTAHPGPRVKDCSCPRCAAKFDDGTRPEPPTHCVIRGSDVVSGKIAPEKILCAKVQGWIPVPSSRKLGDKIEPANICIKCTKVYKPGLRFCCSRCEECCTCL